MLSQVITVPCPKLLNLNNLKLLSQSNLSQFKLNNPNLLRMIHFRRNLPNQRSR